MKKALFLFLILMSGSVLFAQQKFALVIGNSDYTGISRLNNPLNDANDMETALSSLGFSVNKVLNGNHEEIEEAVLELRENLQRSRNSYGFFFYAGHGVQSNGENYLIPVAADNIRSDAQLRQRAISLQFVLDTLSDAGNQLNIIVLDACRDNPFGWARSGSRGLSVVSHAPSGSIVMNATGANSTAADGTNRNGLFTSHLLNNLRNQNLSVFDVFDRTMDNVISATNGNQYPELSLRFAGASSAYLGRQPSPAPVPSQTFEIGDIGPAGGIIFHDKGSFSDGWRYLEAAPASTERKNLQWGTLYYNVLNTQVRVGSGKENTRFIIEVLRDRNETNRAAQICDELNFGRYNDWFLPSRDELQLMYQNLHSRGLGDFQNARYWSSSQNNDRDVWYIHFGDNGRPSNNYAKDRTALLFFSDDIYTRAIRSF